MHTTKGDNANKLHQQDVFGSDEEDEAEVYLEGELVSALQQLITVRK